MGSLDGAGNEMGNMTLMTLEWTFWGKPRVKSLVYISLNLDLWQWTVRTMVTILLEYQRVLGALDAMVDLDLAGIWRFGGAAP